jgi:CRP-like cAMP-binding protein
MRSTPAAPVATIENVSRRVDAMRVHAGETVVREGDLDDRFFLVAEGGLDVSCERGAYPPVGAGDVFGEIALLQDVRRTATVTATGADWGSGFGYVRTATVVAASDLRLLVLPPDRLGVLIHACRALGDKLQAVARERMRRI